MLNWFRLVGLASTRAAYKNFLKDTREPERAQEQLWQSTRPMLEKAPFWSERIAGMARPLRLEDFEITDYTTYETRLQEESGQAGSGAVTVSTLSGDPILYWAESSGTTGRRKLFPITAEYQKQFQAVNGPSIHSMLQRFPGMLGKPVLYFTASQPTEKTPAGIDIGYISARNYATVPALFRSRYAFPLQAVADPETQRKWASLYALKTDLSAILAITPGRIRLFAEELQERFPEFLEYLEGRAAVPSGFPSPRADRKRVEMLKQAFRRRPFSFREVWPSLGFMACWKSSGCALQLPGVAPYLDGLPVVDVVYSATEGWVNVPLFNDRNGGPLHPGSTLVEFARVDGPVTRETLLKPWQLEPDQDYEVFFTNRMGLVRYRLYDVVRCTGFYNRSPLIEFVRKASSEVILGMIRVSEEQLIAAVSPERALQSPVRLLFFTNPEGDQLVLGHDASIELDSAMASRVEGVIAELNKYYRRDLASGLLRPLKVRKLERDDPRWPPPGHAQSKPRIISQ